MGSLRKNIKIEGNADQQRYQFAMDAAVKEGHALTVLELGCDDGTFAFGFAQLGHKVTAVDIDCSRALSEHSHENVEYVTAAVETLKYENVFDIVHAGEILEHVQDPDSLMKLICKSVIKQGLIMISVPDFEHPEHVRTFSRTEFKNLLKKYNINGTIRTIKHNMTDKKRRSKRFAIYNGRIKNKKGLLAFIKARQQK